MVTQLHISRASQGIGPKSETKSQTRIQRIHPASQAGVAT